MVYPSKLSLPAITQTAVEIATESGLAAVGVRPVAERLGVRPSALYRHCGDGDGLVALVAEHAARELHTHGILALQSADQGRQLRPEVAFHALAHAYQKFAMHQPALYAAITTDTSRSVWAAQPGSARKALWVLLLEVVGRLTGEDDDTSATVATWSFLHGFASLGAAGLFGASGPKHGFARGLDALTTGLRDRRTPKVDGVR